MDIEGAELNAIRGAKKKLASNDAVLVIEWLSDRKSREQTEEIYNILTKLNYEIYKIEGDGLNKIKGVEDFYNEPKYGRDFLCIKTKKIDKVSYME